MNRIPYINREQYKTRNKVRFCKICGKESVKGQYCQSCHAFLCMMQKRDQA